MPSDTADACTCSYCHNKFGPSEMPPHSKYYKNLNWGNRNFTEVLLTLSPFLRMKTATFVMTSNTSDLFQIVHFWFLPTLELQLPST